MSDFCYLSVTDWHWHKHSVKIVTLENSYIRNNFVLSTWFVRKVMWVSRLKKFNEQIGTQRKIASGHND